MEPVKTPHAKSSPDPAAVLGKATLRAAARMGLSRDELSAVIGRDRSSISRSGIDPDSKPGELALLLLRCYRSLAVLVDDDEGQIREWLAAANTHTGGVPREQLRDVAGLVTVTGYLDAIRGKL
ncbi:MbcA/ParS/Xre antitoxin family protein [Lentisalinibacter orientalis]|uniref:MbcA/ParS/Xre antitoxin family protein n=1 Tax=Lentisalinibacter orientalis TaxID=2992241 RepID=UPI00386BBAF9